MTADHTMDKVMSHIDERFKENKQRDEDFWL